MGTPHRGATTVRLPHELVEQARQVRGDRESFNDLVVEAVEREVRRRQGLKTLKEIRGVREQLHARFGVQPDSVPLIRALREEGRHG